MQWNQALMVPDRAGALTWAAVDIRKSMLGRVVTLLFKMPAITMSVSTKDGRTQAYRMVPGTMREGFLLAPLIVEQDDFLDLFAPDRAAVIHSEVESIRFDMPPSWAPLFDELIDVRFDRLEFEPALNQGATRILRDDKPMALLKRSAPASPLVRPLSILGTTDALLAHAPTRLSISVPPESGKLSLKYGIDPASLLPPNEGGDGVTFIVEASTTATSSELWRRHLDPKRDATQQGPQMLTLDVPRGTTKVILKTDAGPSGNSAWDWSYWADLQFLQ